MAVKKLTIDCNCKVSLCEHAFEKVGDLLQSGYDDGYDEGWKDAFSAVKLTLAELGFDSAKGMSTPPPPPRARKNKGSNRRSPGTSRELPN